MGVIENDLIEMDQYADGSHDQDPRAVEETQSTRTRRVDRAGNCGIEQDAARNGRMNMWRIECGNRIVIRGDRGDALAAVNRALDVADEVKITRLKDDVGMQKRL